MILASNFFINRISRHGVYRILLTSLFKIYRISRKRKEEIQFRKNLNSALKDDFRFPEDFGLNRKMNFYDYFPFP